MKSLIWLVLILGVSLSQLGFAEATNTESTADPLLLYVKVPLINSAKLSSLQARSGIKWLSGDEGDPPTPMTLAIADMLAGHNLCEGILACLVRRGVTGRGGLVETSLIEALLDFQFEVLTTHLNDGRHLPRRSAFRNAHAYLAAPYRVYDTANGYLALAMTHLPTLGKLLDLPALQEMSNQADGFRRRDEIKQIIAQRLKQHTTEHWLEILNAADIWCAEVLDGPKLCDSLAFQQLAMLQTLGDGCGIEILTTRIPIRVDGGLLTSERVAPRVGQHAETIQREFGL